MVCVVVLWVGTLSACCLWDCLVWVWGSECVLRVREFGLGMGE